MFVGAIKLSIRLRLALGGTKLVLNTLPPLYEPAILTSFAAVSDVDSNVCFAFLVDAQHRLVHPSARPSEATVYEWKCFPDSWISEHTEPLHK